MPRKSDLYVFLHLHKTAGMTFLANVRRNFEEDEYLRLYAGSVGLKLDDHASDQGWDRAAIEEYVRSHASPRIRLVYGHMVYSGIHEYFGDDRVPFYMTFLRDPVERVISLYAYHLRFGGAWHQELVENPWSIEEWLEQSSMLWRSDGQVRQLLWHAHGEALQDQALTRAHLDDAKRLLERFAFVGTTETFEQDAAYLYAKLGLRRFHGEPVVNATPDKDDVPAGVRAQIAERNRLDGELYEFATALRESFLRSHGLSYRLQAKKSGALRRLAAATTRRAAPPPPPEPEPAIEAPPPRRPFIQLKELPPGDAGSTDDVVAAQRRRFVARIWQPLVLVTGVEYGDGPALARLLDGHRSLHVHPFELEVSNPIGSWPVLDVTEPPLELWRYLRERTVVEPTPHGERKLSRGEANRRLGVVRPDLPFMFAESLQKRLFVALLERNVPKSPRHVLNAYATSYFNAWLDYTGLYRFDARFWVASIPRFLADAANAARFLDDYRDGRLVVLVRDPVAVWASAEAPGDADPGEAIIDLWLRFSRNALAAADAYPRRVTLVKFEDLLEQPDRALPSLLGALGLEVEQSNARPTFNGIPIEAEPPSLRREAAPDEVAAIRARTDGIYARLLSHTGVGSHTNRRK